MPSSKAWLCLADEQHISLNTARQVWMDHHYIQITTNVLFICKTKSRRLRRRHCGLARQFKIDPTESVALCFGYAKTLFWRRRHCGLARHFKTDTIKIVALCFGYAKTLFWRADGRADEQDTSLNKPDQIEFFLKTSLNTSQQVSSRLNTSQHVAVYYENHNKSPPMKNSRHDSYFRDYQLRLETLGGHIRYSYKTVLHAAGFLTCGMSNSASTKKGLWFFFWIMAWVLTNLQR
jgi:hypothetical protein